MSKKFERKIENFVCEHCQAKVVGNGYTNHCPKCLWSKHVDINPGDRAEKCGGLMEPVFVELEKGQYVVTYKCEICGLKKRNHILEGDNIDELIRLSEILAKKAMF